MQELDLLAHAIAAANRLPQDVTIPPGDDLAAIRIPNSITPATTQSDSAALDHATTILIGCDQVVESRHYDPGEDPYRVGYKAVARNVSDVAAMAASPIACVSSILLPAACGTQRGKQLLDAIRQAGEQMNCPVIGGDVAFTDDGPEVINVTILAHPNGIEPIKRGGGQPGDFLYVTGKLGGSIHGWHLKFTPRIQIARTLAAEPATRPSAMMDLSDGLAMDLPRLAAASNCGATIQINQVPISPSVHTPSHPRSTQEPWRHAIGDGEDYELLIASPNKLPKQIDGVPLTQIGQLKPASQGIVWLSPDGTELQTQDLGWEHTT